MRRVLLAILALTVLVKPLRPQTAELVVQTGHIDSVNAVAFSPDGRQIVSGSTDGTCKLWDVHTGLELRTFAEPGDRLGLGRVTAAVFSPDGARVYTLDGGAIKVWKASTGRKLSEIRTDASFETFALSHATGRLVAAVSTGEVRLFDAAGVRIRDLVHSSYFVWERIVTLAFSPDGKFVAGGSHDRTIKLWDAQTGEQIGTPLSGHSHWVVSVVFSPDGKLLASAGADDVVRVWDLAKRTSRVTIPAPAVQAITFTQNGERLIGGNGAGEIRLWDAATGVQLRRVEAHHGQFSRAVNSVAVSGDGTRIVSGGDDRAIRLWDGNSFQFSVEMTGTTSLVTDVAISPTGLQIITGSYDGTIKIWNLDDRNAYEVLADGNPNAEFLDYSPDGNVIATAGDGIRFWSSKTGAQITDIDPEFAGDPQNSVMFTPDGKRLVTRDQRSAIKLWDATSGLLIRPLFVQSTMASQMGSNVSHVAFSPDGRRFVTATGSGRIALWNAVPQKQIRQMAGRVNVSRLMFSPDGTQVVAGAYYEKALRFWQVSTGEEIKYEVPPKWVNLNAGRFAFGRLGATMVKAEANAGRVVLFDARSGRELASIISLGNEDWAVTTFEGRFDTSMPLDNIHGIHWVLSDDPFTPKPLELFMRQYYEPGLLPRLLNCNKEGNCNKEFKPLPPIGQVNRVQPWLEKPLIAPGLRR